MSVPITVVGLSALTAGGEMRAGRPDSYPPRRAVVTFGERHLLPVTTRNTVCLFPRRLMSSAGGEIFLSVFGAADGSFQPPLNAPCEAVDIKVAMPLRR